MNKEIRVVQISIIGRVYGNVNADEVIGDRITLKKMYSSTGEVLPFVSARAIKRAIREAFASMGLPIDPFIAGREEALPLMDSGDPVKYVDNDLFGYMVTRGEKHLSFRRQAPVAISYFKALRSTAVKSEFAGRFPRSEEHAPVPFEIEVADFIGKLNCIIYDYIGNFEKEKERLLELYNEKKDSIYKTVLDKGCKLDDNERRDRLRTFLNVFLTPLYILPRRTNSLNMIEYLGTLVFLSKRGPMPIYSYLTYDFDNGVVKVADKLREVLEIIPSNEYRLTSIDYKGEFKESPEYIENKSLKEVINEIVEWMFPR